MNKNELIKQLALKCDTTQSKADEFLNAFTEAIEDALKEGDSVKLIGFGTFSVTQRAAKTGRNPSTGKPIKIPASNHAKFKAGKQLKDAVN